MKYPGKITIDGVEHDCVIPMYDEVVIRSKYMDSVVLLDEANQCSQATMAANQEEWFNNPPEKAIVIAAANDAAIATDGFEFPAPMVNRMCILDWEFDDDAWDEGLLNAGKFPAPEFPVLVGDWDGYKDKWCKLLHQFKREHPQHFAWKEVFPTTPEEQSKPWRSPRSWFRGVVCLAAAEACGANRDTALDILTGFVGLGPATEFFHWLDVAGFPSSEELYNNPDRLRLPPQFDTAASLVSGVHCYCSRQVEQTPDKTEKQEHFERGLDFCERVFENNRELGSSFVGRFVKLKPSDYAPGRRSHPLWDTIAASRKPVMAQ